MANPAIEKKDIREEIIKAAQDVFAKYGFKKTTMDEIAAASYKAKSSMYHYFKSKEEIFKIIVEREAQALGNHLVEIISRVNSSEEKMRLYILTRMKEIHRLANFYSAIKDDYLDNYSFIENIRKEHDEKEIHLIMGLLDDGVKKGVFRKDIDTQAMAYVFVVALKGFEVEWVKADNTTMLEKALGDLVGYLINGIAKK
jgi:AcrR family transcriptional regulator